MADDPDFETKAADVIGLYLKPPDHAAVFAVNEKTAIQALDRLDPVLPLSPGRAERHGFEYYRYGTQSGAVLGQTVPRHTSAAFVGSSRAGIFTAVADLTRKIRRYIRHNNKAPKPIRWASRNPRHRIGSTSASTVH